MTDPTKEDIMTETPKPTHYLPVHNVTDEFTPSGEVYERATYAGFEGECTLVAPPGTLIPIPEPAPDRKLRVGDRLRATRNKAHSIQCKVGDIGTVTRDAIDQPGPVGFTVNNPPDYVIPPTAAGAADVGWELIEPDAESEAQAKLDALLAEMDDYAPARSHQLRRIIDRYRPTPATPAERLRLAVRDGGVPDGDARRAILTVAAELEREAVS